MESPNWLSYLSAIGTIATPILILGLTGIGWRWRSKLERKIDLENKMRSDRIEIYNQLLEPFIILMTTEEAWKSDPEFKKINKQQFAHQKLLSVKYRENSFRMALLANDEVIRANNNLWQYFFQRGEKAEPASENETKEMIVLLGNLLLEIRKNMGNEGTTLSNLEMLEWFFSDARKLK